MVKANAEKAYFRSSFSFQLTTRLSAVYVMHSATGRLLVLQLWFKNEKQATEMHIDPPLTVHWVYPLWLSYAVYNYFRIHI